MQTLKSTGLCLDVRAAPGNTFVDVSRYHHTITNNNVVTVKGMGSGLAGKFDGSTAYLDCGNPSAFDITDAITIETWLKMSEIDTHNYLLSKGSNLYLLNFPLATQTPRIGLAGPTPTAILSSDMDITLNEWTYLSATYDKDAGSNNLKIYLNSVRTGQSTHTGAISVDSNSLSIGSYFTGVHYFNGIISSVRIYNRALPAYEIENHYYEYATLLGID